MSQEAMEERIISDNPILQNEESQCNGAPAEVTRKPKKWLHWFRNIVVFLLACFTLALILYHVIPSPAKTVRNFFYAIMNENYSAAYSHIAMGYKKSRGTLEQFSFEYDNAVRSGTRTIAIRVIETKRTLEKNQKIVVVEIDVYYQGSIVTSTGAYLCEKIPGDGWKIIGNVTSEYNKNKAQKLKPKEQQ